MRQLAQSFRYSITSGICFLLGVTLIPLLTWWGLHYALATCVAFFMICAVGFYVHCFWTFSVESTFKSFIRYVSTLALNLPLTIALIAVGHDLADLSVAAATAMASVILFIWNYLGVRWAVSSGSQKASR